MFVAIAGKSKPLRYPENALVLAIRKNKNRLFSIQEMHEVSNSDYPTLMKKSFFLKTALALIMIAGMTGCITARKVDKWVGRHYAQTVPTKFKTADYITFKN